MWNKTSIICTLGPATSKRKTLLSLISAGMDIARLNFSHGDLEQHRGFIKLVRDCSQRAGRAIGILQDLPGPKLRAGKLPGDTLELHAGEQVLLSPRPQPGLKHLPFPDQRLLRALKPGNDVWLADGMSHLKVLKVEDGAALCRSLSHAVLRSHCGVNLPHAGLSIAAFTAADRRYLRFGLAQGVDFVAVSFVSGPEDLRAVRRALAGARRKPRLIAKIERAEAMDRLPDIVRESDAVMVARGDLGVELPFSQVPFAQKEIVAECRRQGRPVIVATQMLESMISSPRPTRAEMTDIANAVLDGADAVMLSGETSVGKFPREAVAALAAVAREAEAHLEPQVCCDYPFASPSARAIAASAVTLAEGVRAKAIVVPTFTGDTARCVSHLKPRCPIVALCAPGPESQLTLLWGVRAYVVPGLGRRLEGILAESRRAARRLRLARPGESIVVTCSLPGRGTSDGRITAAVRV
ncbi:MAG: pyruvate kinase [Elusimicrobia bacterium]|nr:pyruvate kinase [Elusimicrobiota bacterium]